MTYEEDTSLLLITLVTGMGYDLNPHWRIDGEFSYRAAYYQFTYRNEGSGVLNSFTKGQDQWISTIGLSYRF
jgi:long-subunit fatty acid transport protein